MKRTKKNALLDVARKMPPLYHKFPGEENFNWKSSVALQWLIQQPEILKFVWDSIKGQTGGHGGTPLIVFNRDTHTWQGVDYDGD